MGRVHAIQSMGTLDGPGVRFVVFVSGCPLRCLYCHNPDTWDPSGGVERSVEELLQRIERVLPYLSGGITVSGGEPLMQAGFVAALFRGARAMGLHTALDTSGALMPEGVDELLRVTDLCLLDIKMTDDRMYRRYASVGLEGPLKFLQRLNELGVSTWLRQVVIPGVNDTPEQIDALARLAIAHSCCEKIELLPFKKLCQEKYDALGIPFPLKDTPQMDGDKLAALQRRVDALRSGGV